MTKLGIIWFIKKVHMTKCFHWLANILIISSLFLLYGYNCLLFCCWKWQRPSAASLWYCFGKRHIRGSFKKYVMPSILHSQQCLSLLGLFLAMHEGIRNKSPTKPLLTQQSCLPWCLFKALVSLTSAVIFISLHWSDNVFFWKGNSNKSQDRNCFFSYKRYSDDFLICSFAITQENTN